MRSSRLSRFDGFGLIVREDSLVRTIWRGRFKVISRSVEELKVKVDAISRIPS